MTGAERTKAKARLRELESQIQKLQAEYEKLEAQLGCCSKSENCMQTDGHRGGCTDYTIS